MLTDCTPVRLHVCPLSITSCNASKSSPAVLGPKIVGSKCPETLTLAGACLAKVLLALLLSFTPVWL